MNGLKQYIVDSLPVNGKFSDRLDAAKFYARCFTYASINNCLGKKARVQEITDAIYAALTEHPQILSEFNLYKIGR